MPLDTSIALQAKAPEFNPLQTALQVAQYRAYNANGLAAQQGLDANRAISKAYQQATDPTTGQVDNNKLMGIISQDPAAGFKLGEVVQGINTQKQQQQTLARGDLALGNDQLDSAQKHLSWAYQTAGAIANNPNAKPSDVTAAVGRAIDNGQITPQVAAQALADMPGADAPQGALQLWAANHVAQAAGAAQQLGIALPEGGSIDKGGQILLTNRNKLTGDVSQVGSINKTMDPGTASTPTPMYDPSTGMTGNIPRSQFAGGQPPPLPTVAQPPNMPASGGQAAPMPSGPAPGSPRGFVPTGPAIGAAGIADDAGKRYGALTSAASAAKQVMGQYDNAAALVSSTMKGKGSGGVIDAAAVLNSMGVPVGKDAVESRQLLTNYLSSATDQAAQSLGMSGSDARLAAVKAGQPSADTMNGPALYKSIMHVKGLQQAVLEKHQAETAYLAANGNNTANLNQWEARWNKSFNPEVSYVRTLNNPQEQQAAMQEMKAQGKLGAWMKDYKAMKEMGAF